MSCQTVQQMGAPKQRQLTKWIHGGDQKHTIYLLVPVHHIDHFVLCVGVYIGPLITNILILDPLQRRNGRMMNIISNFFKKLESLSPNKEVEGQRKQEIKLLKVCHSLPLSFQPFISVIPI